MYATLFLALATSVLAAPIVQRGKPSDWATGYLENYDTYHTRYLALDCQDKHNTAFFDDCCHPLLANETLANDRKAYCTPDASASSSAAASPTTSADPESESEYCESEASSSAAPSASASPTPAGQEAVAAAPTSSAAAEPSSSSAPAPSSTSAAAPAPSSGGGNGGGNTNQGGFATFFYQGGAAGACGNYNSDNSYIAAITPQYFGSSDGSSPSSHCGQTIHITNTENGKSVDVVVADLCPTCANGNSIDLSVAAFTAIATEDQGSVSIDWQWA